MFRYYDKQQYPFCRLISLIVKFGNFQFKLANKDLITEPKVLAIKLWVLVLFTVQAAEQTAFIFKKYEVPSNNKDDNILKTEALQSKARTNKRRTKICTNKQNDLHSRYAVVITKRKKIA